MASQLSAGCIRNVRTFHRVRIMTHPAGRRLLVALLAVASTTACLDQSRVNPRCQWTDPTRLSRLDLRDAAQRSHLATDVQVAEELGVRAGDAVKRQVGVSAAGRVSVACTEQVFGSIMREHGVTRAEIDSVRGARDAWVDIAAVYLPMLLLLAVASDMTVRRLLVIPREDRWLFAAGLVFFAVAASAMAIGVTQFWAGIVNDLRLGDSHLSYRGFYLPINRHGWIAFFTGIAVFSIAAARRCVVGAPRVSSAHWRRT